MPKKAPIDIHKIARLAKLSLRQEEQMKFEKQLTGILAFVSKLQQIDTKDIDPTSQVTGLTNVFRQDEIDISRTLTQEQALKNAPAAHNGYFKVPAVLEK